MSIRTCRKKPPAATALPEELIRYFILFVSHLFYQLHYNKSLESKISCDHYTYRKKEQHQNCRNKYRVHCPCPIVFILGQNITEVESWNSSTNTPFFWLKKEEDSNEAFTITRIDKEAGYVAHSFVPEQVAGPFAHKVCSWAPCSWEYLI